MRRIAMTIGLVMFASLLVAADNDGCACSPARIDDYPSDSTSGSHGTGGGSTTMGTGGESGGGGGLCGNGMQDEGEGCDDGNTTSGDGCAADCTLEECFECSGTACTIAAGNKCTLGDGGAGFCNSKAQCGDHCDDDVLDEGESDLDCGGPCTTKCKQGQMCKQHQDCPKYCHDGVCCDVACKVCRKCNLASSLGTCVDVPSGVDDEDTDVSNATTKCDVDSMNMEDDLAACSGGSCDDSGLYRENGVACSMPDGSECISGTCSAIDPPSNGVKCCGLAPGVMCTQNEECASSSCSNGSCGMGAACKSSGM